MPRKPGIPGLSPATERAIRDLFPPGEISAAYHSWRRAVTGSFTAWERSVLAPNGVDFTDVVECPCCDALDEGRATLDRAVGILPARAAAELRRQILLLDTQMWNKARHAGATYRLTAWFVWHDIPLSGPP